MEYEQFFQWVHQIYNTTEVEIDCARLQTLIPAYIDLEIAGENPAGRWPQIGLHLAQCPDCREEYDALRTVAELEAREGLPEVGEGLAPFEEGESATALT